MGEILKLYIKINYCAVFYSLSLLPLFPSLSSSFLAPVSLSLILFTFYLRIIIIFHTHTHDTHQHNHALWALIFIFPSSPLSLSHSFYFLSQNNYYIPHTHTRHPSAQLCSMSSDNSWVWPIAYTCKDVKGAVPWL